MPRQSALSGCHPAASNGANASNISLPRIPPRRAAEGPRVLEELLYKEGAASQTSCVAKEELLCQGGVGLHRPPGGGWCAKYTTLCAEYISIQPHMHVWHRRAWLRFWHVYRGTSLIRKCPTGVPLLQETGNLKTLGLYFLFRGSY